MIGKQDRRLQTLLSLPVTQTITIYLSLFILTGGNKEMGLKLKSDTKINGDQLLELIKKRKLGYTDKKNCIYGVYQILNLKNDKIYIGSSSHMNGGIKRRWYEHVTALQNNCHANTHLQRAWNLYGAENFQFSIIEDIDRDKQKILEREQYYIDYFFKIKGKDNCYNINKLATGGNEPFCEQDVKDGKSVYSWEQYVKMKELLINTNLSFKEIQRRTGIRKKTISDIYHKISFINDYNGIDIPIRETVGKKLEKNNSESIIKRYKNGESLKNIGKQFDVSRDTIKRILIKNNIEIRDSEESCSKKVYQYSDEGAFIKEYNSVSQAGKENKIGPTKISKSCLTGYSAGGFLWSYEKMVEYPLTLQEKILGKKIYGDKNPVIQYDLNGNPLFIYPSIRKTSKVLDKKYRGLARKNLDNFIEFCNYKWIFLTSLNENELEKLLKLKNKEEIKVIN